MKKFNNSVNVTGKVFNLGEGRNELGERISKKSGMAFISGDVNVSINDDNTDVTTVHYTYVPETFKSGATNSTYTNLKNLIEANKTIESVGAENADVVRIDGDYETNDFWSTRNNEFVAAPRVRGGFIHQGARNQDFGSTFDVETIISKAVENEDGSATLSGYVFNWRNDIMPITFRAFGNGASWFIDQDISNRNPYVGKVWGNIVNKVETTYEEQDDDVAFGAALKKPVTHNVRYWEIVGAKNPMEFDDESTITKAELKKALEDRQERLEQQKVESEAYRQNNQHSSSSFTNSALVTTAPEVDDDDPDDEFPF